jgi:hypothetical protein
MRVDTISVLTDAVCSKREFKFDIKRLKRHISSCMKSFKKVRSKEKEEKKNLMKKHIFSIRQIQCDMNATVKGLNTSNERNECYKDVRAYRRVEREIFTKYHLSLRDLVRRKIIRRMDWRVRSVLERHGRINAGRFRFGIRIYPGSKKWNVESDEEEFDSDSEDNEVDGDLPATD